MAEPEGLLIEGARLATATARDLWWRVAPPRERARLPLARVRRRLELFLGALYAEAPHLLPADVSPAPVWLARLTGHAPRHLRVRTATAATDGAHIWLPRALDASDGEAQALAAYRLLAVEQAARAARDTPGHAPPARAIRSSGTSTSWPRRSPSTRRSPGASPVSWRISARPGGAPSPSAHRSRG